MNTLGCSLLFTSVCPVKTNEAWLNTSGLGLLKTTYKSCQGCFPSLDAGLLSLNCGWRVSKWNIQIELQHIAPALM